MKLCDKLAKLRKREGLSQEELADKLEVSRQSVFKWESGENTPDLEKIKKLAKLYNVSFDLLLDDEKDLDNQNTEANSGLINGDYRSVFNSGVKLNTRRYADLENGYAEGMKRIKAYPEDYVKSLKTKLKEKNYSKTIKIQHDLELYFFIDENNKTFGFFYRGAAQFVCPFENLAAVSINNSGQQTGFTQTTGVGIGVGSSQSIGVGTMPIGQIRQPYSYDVSISYFDNDGSLKDYTLTINCTREYIIYDKELDIKEPSSMFLWEDLLSESTSKQLNQVLSYLNGIKESASQIRNGLVKVLPLDMDSLNSDIKSSKIVAKELKASLQAEANKQDKRSIILWTVGIGIVVVAIIVFVIILFGTHLIF